MSDFTVVQLLNQKTPVIITGGYVPRGAYDNATDYAVGDSVDYLGSSYVMFVDAAAGTLPTDTTKWQVLAIGHEKATGAEIDTGTDDLKYATPKAITDSKLSFTDGTETLTNKTLTSPKINEDVVMTASATELNVLDGIPATLTATELGYVDGVTSAIQTQLGTKAPATAPTFATSITGSYLTASEILGTGASKEIVSLPVATYPSLAELSYVKGLSSAIQTQLGNKAATDQTMYIGTTQVAINRASAALTLAGLTLTTPDIGTPSAGVATNITGLPAASVLAGTLGTGAYVMDNSLTVPLINGSSADNGDITINGTSSATKTTSYVILQPTGGNVGIGTTAPGAKLDVNGGLFVRSGSEITAQDGINLFWNGGVGFLTGRGTTGYASMIYDGGQHIFRIEGAEKMRLSGYGGLSVGYADVLALSGNILASGNVGIGTTAPGAKLDVFGTTRHVLIGDWTTNNGYSAMSFGGTLGSDANLYGAGGQLFINRATGNDISFRENNGTDQVTIKTGGNVGIGTTSPTSLLALGGNSARVFQLERHTTADTAGNTLTVIAGGATSGATNKAGGNLILQGGLSTGTGESGVLIKGVPAGSTGTTDGTQTTGIQVLGNKLGFYGVTAVVRPTALTAVDSNALNTGDATSDTVIGNIRTRLGELETKLQSLGLLT